MNGLAVPSATLKYIVCYRYEDCKEAGQAVLTILSMVHL